MRRRVLLRLAPLVLIGALGAGGYAVGAATAPSDSEAARERAEAERRAFTSAFRRARTQGRTAGYRRGRRLGAARGRELGRRRGLEAGQQGAAQKRVQQAQAAEAERQQAIEQRARERAENCGAPLFVEGYCPTDEEIETENQAEALCGPGTEQGRREAAERGIDC